MKKKVAVIGAGPNGLVAAKYLKENFDVTIFEKESKIGGTWNIDKGQPGLTVQSKKEAYCYTDFYYSKKTSKFPTYKEVYNYLQSYARQFDLYSLLKLNVELLEMRRGENNEGWLLKLKEENLTYESQFDFVVLANGVFNVTYFPDFKVNKESDIKVIHSADFNDLDLLKGDDIVVIGAGKSGLHLATHIKKAYPKKNVTIVFRKGRRIIPKRFLGIISYNRLFFSPFRSVLRPNDNLPFFEKMAFKALKPLSFIASHFVKKATKSQLNIKKRPYFAPKNSNGCGSLLVPDSYMETIKEIDIYPESGIKKLDKNAVILNDEKVVKASTVIFATGFKQCVNFLPKEIKEKIVDSDGQIWLYKHVLHPDLPDVAFASHAIGMNSILNGEICARWINAYLLGKIHLPGEDSIRNHIKQQKEYYNSHRYKNNARSACVTPSDHFWIREMTADIGKRRKKRLGLYLFDYLFCTYSKHYRFENLIDI